MKIQKTDEMSIQNQNMDSRNKNTAITLANLARRSKRPNKSDKTTSEHGISAELNDILKNVSTHFSVHV